MATTRTNQNRQFYVVSGYNASVTSASDVGTIGAKVLDNELYFLYRGADTMLKSDRIPLDGLYAKAIEAADMVIPLKTIEVTLDANVNSRKPVTGQDYLIRIAFKQFYGMGDADQYFKDAAVHVTSAIDNAKKLFDAMKAALDKAFSREIGATASSNPYLDFSVSGSGDSAKLVITEKVQDWNLGVGHYERVMFDVFPTTIYTGGEDVHWGVVTDATPAKADAVVGTTGVGNGQRIADLEWFLMGERGDQYREIGWPNNIPTKYLVDPTKEYHVIEFHFAFTDTGVNSYRSEKDITLVVPAGADDALYTAINDVIAGINTAVGSTLIAEFS